MPWTSQLSTYALITLAEGNAALNEDAQTPDSRPIDDRKEAIINALSVEIENFLDRHIVTRGSLTEHHTPVSDQTVLYLRQWPGLTLTSVHEDANAPSVAVASRYPASTLLVENTDHEKEFPTAVADGYAKLVRIGTVWAVGRKTVKVVYTAGVANTAAVPTDIKAVAQEVFARRWLQESRRRTAEEQTYSDAAGTVSRMLPALLTAKDRDRLRPYQRIDFCPTWVAA